MADIGEFSGTGFSIEALNQFGGIHLGFAGFRRFPTCERIEINIDNSVVLDEFVLEQLLELSVSGFVEEFVNFMSPFV
jgi:hypothetical protein